MQSRFMKNDVNPTILVLASSKRTEQSYMETFIESKKKNESNTTLVIDEPQWVIRSDKNTNRKFNVAVGNKFLSSEVIPLDATENDLSIYRDRGYNIIQVPMGYYENFIDDIDVALTDIAGISTSSSSRYISGPRLAEVKHPELHNPFTKEIIEVGNGPEDNTQYSDFFNLENVNKDMMEKPLFVHLDMSISGDKTGIAGVWIKGIKTPEEGKPDNHELVYELAFSVSIKAPKGYQISFEKNRQFIYWLRDNGFNVKGVSCFPADTKVATPNGPKQIRDLIPGDTIYSYYDGGLIENPLKCVIPQGVSEEFINVELFDGYTIKCTPNHPILTTDGYVEARFITNQSEIIVDDKLYYRYMLLKTGVFIDNEYFNKYIDLICTPDLGEYVEQHHIVPHFISKGLNIHNEETVTLNYTNHFLAHYYLLHCILDNELKQKAAYACKMMYDDNKLPKSESCVDTHLLECIKDAKIQYSKNHSDKMKNSISRHASGTHWYNNGIKEIRIKGDCPEGFVKGRLPISDEIKHKMSLSALNRKGGVK